MFLTDDHLHTRFSFDGKADPEDVCRQAIGRGLSEICITDHMDIYSDQPYTYQLDCENWKKTMDDLKEKYRGKLLVHVGIELGQPQINPKQARIFMEKYSMDFIIGSIHNIENDLDIYYCDYKNMDIRKFYSHYIDWLMELAKNYDFDVMGHITYPSRYILEQTGTAPDMTEFYDRFRQLFKCVIEKGRGIELNLSGLARGGGKPMPEEDLLKLYRECGGEIITVGSDAHVASQVGTISKAGQEILAGAGFRYITWFEERKAYFERI
ncbi:histidinol-phosphatase (PHP family) [Catenibacillus scindens]|uniref:Histidinol-phosphatase n=1 Tax=Catenibacillus scindens TaxID=673271 RepID=A0A7W8H8K4_9FIRM|nr:histidinol-phosphatase HisJ family protein [Catenibacillus scindens]MBB5263142.1 histidinol-phosphatase (PHP family) [Catenibacillus scindens]